MFSFIWGFFIFCNSLVLIDYLTKQGFFLALESVSQHVTLIYLKCTHGLSDAKVFLVYEKSALFSSVGTGLLHRPYVIIGANNRHQKNPVLALEHF